MEQDKETKELLSHPAAQGLKQEARAHWKEFRPKMYRELAQSGKLEEALDKSVAQTLRENTLIIQQLQDKEKPEKDYLKRVRQLKSIQQQAWELVREKYLFLPAEQDKPNL